MNRQRSYSLFLDDFSLSGERPRRFIAEARLNVSRQILFHVLPIFTARDGRHESFAEAAAGRSSGFTTARFMIPPGAVVKEQIKPGGGLESGPLHRLAARDGPAGGGRSRRPRPDGERVTTSFSFSSRSAGSRRGRPHPRLFSARTTWRQAERPADPERKASWTRP